jgi:hypothetical protein
MQATSVRLLIACAAISTAFAAEISGKWVGSMASGNSVGSPTATVYLNLRQQADAIAGTIAFQDETKQVPIEKPQLKGDQFTFEVHDNPDRVVKFRLTASEETLSGEGTSGEKVVKIKLTRP